MNKKSKILIWISIGCYVIATCVILVGILFTDSFEGILSDMDTLLVAMFWIGFFVIGFICALIATFLVSKPGDFKIFSIASTVVSLIAIILMYTNIFAYNAFIISLFVSCIIAALSSLLAGILFHSEQQLFFSTSKDTQSESKEVTHLCSNCGLKNERTSKFCRECGFSFLE